MAYLSKIVDHLDGNTLNVTGLPYGTIAIISGISIISWIALIRLNKKYPIDKEMKIEEEKKTLL